MSKKCNFCHSELPDEANFCLNCMSECKPAEVVPEKSSTRRRQIFNLAISDHINHFRFKTGKILSILKCKKRKLNKKQTAVLSAAIVCLLFISVFAIAYPGSNDNNIIENTVAEQDSTDVTHSNKVVSFFKDVLGIETTASGKDEQNTTNQNSKNPDKNSPSKNTNINNNGATNTTNKFINNHSNTSTTGKEQSSQSSSNNNTNTELDSGNNSDSIFDSEENFDGSQTIDKPNLSDEPSSYPTANSGDFEYELSYDGKYYIITDYLKNEDVVSIPAKNGELPIREVAKKAFENKKVKYVYFESISNQKSLTINGGSFYNCPNLVKITFPKTAMLIRGNITQECPNVSTLGGITSESGYSYRFIDGVLYNIKGNGIYTIVYICPNAGIETLNVPTWCKGFEPGILLNECKDLKTINMHVNCISLISSYTKGDTIAAVNVESGSSHAFSKDGVLFRKTSTGIYKLNLYPVQKKDTVFVVPDNVTFDVYSGTPVNKYLEILYIPKSAALSGAERIAKKQAFTNLKTIYVESGSSYEDYFKENFSGKVLTY